MLTAREALWQTEQLAINDFETHNRALKEYIEDEVLAAVASKCRRCRIEIYPEDWSEVQYVLHIVGYELTIAEELKDHMMIEVKW